MKRSLKIVILLAVAAVLAGGYFFITHRQEQVAATTETVETVPLVDHSSDELTALSWSTEDGVIRFVKGEDWSLASDASVPVNTYSLDSQADLVMQLAATRAIDNVTDRSVYGLNEPTFTVTAEWSDGTSTTYSQGSETTFQDGWYLGRSGDDRVYIIADDLSDSLGRTLNSLIVKETIPSAENVTRVTTATVDAEKAEQSRSVNTDLLWYDTKGNALDTVAAEALRDGIADLKWYDIVTGSASEEKLTEYGFGDSAVTLCLYDGETAARTLLIGNEDAEGNRYAKLPDSKMVYTISADSLTDILAATDETLANGDTLLTVPYEDVASATIKAGALEYALETIDQRPAAAEETAAESADTAAENTDTAAASAETATADAGADTATETVDPTADDEVLWQLVTALTPNGAAEKTPGETVLEITVTNINGLSGTLTVAEYDADNYAASLDGGKNLLVSADRTDKIIRSVRQMAKGE